MITTVFSTTDSPYMNWQADLLEFSWKEVGQPGELIRLVATHNRHNLPQHEHARVIHTWPWDVHPLTGDYYPVYNKPASPSQWLHREQPEGTILLVDPDCVFRSPIAREVEEGHPVSQAWIDYHPHTHFYTPELDVTFEVIQRFCRNNLDSVQGVMIPTLLHAKDFSRIIGRWLELTALIRQGMRHANGKPLWESDMFGYILAAAEYGLIHVPAHLGICTNWSPQDVPNAPIIHYCQPILSYEDDPIWSKRTYTPWEEVGDPCCARMDYGQDLLEMLNRFRVRRQREACVQT